MGTQATRTERRKASTAAAILMAAERLFLGQGYLATTVDALAQEADVAIGTVYAHFGSKEGVYAALVDRALELDAAYSDEGWASGTGPVERLIGLSGGYLRFALEHPRFYRVFRFPSPDSPRGSEVDAALARVAQRVRDETVRMSEALQEAISAGVVRPVDPKTAAIFLWTAWDGLIAAHVLPHGAGGFDENFDAVLTLGRDVFMRGFLAEGEA